MKISKKVESETAQLALLLDDGVVAYDPEGAGKAAGNVSKSEVYRAVERGDLIARKLGRRTVILKSDLVEWIRRLPRFEEDNKIIVGGNRKAQEAAE